MTPSTSAITFGPFRLDAAGPRLWRGDAPVPIQARPLAVLTYLAQRPGVVVGRDELIAGVWQRTYVSKAVLKVAVRALRGALGDDAAVPRYVETVGRQGYRFLPHSGDADPSAAAAPMVGRTDDVAALQSALADAAGGTRRIVFVTGDAGIGKTTLIDRFLDVVQRDGAACVARGQCLEPYGESEAYLPVLEAVGRLARDAGAPGFADAVRRWAPTWLRHLPALAADARPAPRDGDASATVPARMLREMADAFEVFTEARPLVLVLEDLQWSDPSTLDLVACLARRREPARLLIVGSGRPVAADHPLRVVRGALLADGRCLDLPLRVLSPDDVLAWLEARFSTLPPAETRRLATRVQERTGGNALFMVNVVDDLVARGVVLRRDGRWHVDRAREEASDPIPHGLRDLLAHRIDAIDHTTRRVLEVASVVGDEFEVATVAAVVGADVEHVEELCEQVAAHGWLLADAGVAERPDGAVTGRYRFQHALYRAALYDGIAAARRMRVHRAVGACEESVFASRLRERAAALAMHFTAGREHARAVDYHALAAAAAVERHAAHEAVAHLAAALDALAHLPADAERNTRELALVVDRATLLMAVRGYAAADTRRAFARARALCDVVPSSRALHPVLRGLVSYHHVRAELDDARQLGETLLAHAAEEPDDTVLRVQAHYGHGATLFHTGQLAGAREHLETALHEYEPASHREHVRVYGGYDPGVACSMWLAWTLALLGYVDAALAWDRDGLDLAQRLGDVFSLAWAHHAASVSRQFFGDWTGSAAAAMESMLLAERHGFPHVLAMARINRGWSLIMLGDAPAGIPLLRDGVAAVEATGAALVRPAYLGMLGMAELLEGDGEAALRRVDEGLALVARTGERMHEASLLIARGRLLAGGGASSLRAARAAETALRRAVDVARAQGARLLELRATMTLAQLRRVRGRVAEARDELAAACAWFDGARTEVPAVAAARRLLGELAAA